MGENTEGHGGVAARGLGRETAGGNDEVGNGTAFQI